MQVFRLKPPPNRRRLWITRSWGASHVTLFKGESWLGNESRGIIHRPPQWVPGERRLLSTSN
ncbi:DUF1826 domain-containing protein [Pseudomonas sp. CR3202]|uniref:DUF1826 domain-containing protein n=1 Tax=Pseudomonas sp. CR3202 TaxID=3351532 RepID=UPI003BF25534